MKIRIYLLLALIVFVALCCNQAWAGDTTNFTPFADTSPVTAASLNQPHAPINRLEVMGNCDFSDTTFNLLSTAYADSSITTNKIAHQAIDDTCVSDTAGIDYSKVDKNPYMPYARDYQYDSPTVDTTVFQNVRIQFGYKVVQGSDTYFMSGSVSFPTAYDNTYPVVALITCAGYSDTSSSDSYTTSGATGYIQLIHPYSITNTGFSFYIENIEGTGIPPSYYFYFSWVAYGRKD